MSMCKSDKVIAGIAAISFIINCIGLFFMPERIVTHWDHRGHLMVTCKELLGFLC